MNVGTLFGTARLVLGTASLAALLLGARPAPAAEPTEAPPDPAARKLLLDMANFLAHAPALRATMRSDYDAIQPDGQRIAFGERRQITLQRPDKLRVDVERSDGERGSFGFDGRKITAYNARENVYARVDRPGSLDQALVYMVRDLHATVPLARMFTTFFPQDIDRRAANVTFVERCTLFDVPTDHLAIRSADVDLQVWVAHGAQPLPRRIVITYKNQPGQPQFRADFFNWNLTPGIDAATFAFVPPAGAQPVVYLAPKLQAAAPTAAPAGEQQ